MEPDVNANEEIPSTIFLFLSIDNESDEYERNGIKQNKRMAIRLFFKWL